MRLRVRVARRKPCPGGCGEMIPRREMACSASCMRLWGFTEVAAGRPDPFRRRQTERRLSE